MKSSGFVLLLFVLTQVSARAQTNHPLFFVGMELRPKPSLEGTTASLVWQNFKLISLEGLKIIKGDRELEQMISSGVLVDVPQNNCLVIDTRLDSKWRYVLPRVGKLLSNVSRAVCSQFKSSLKVNSAVRHVERQKQLIRDGNANAAPIEGERTSPHLTGASTDLAVVGVPPPVVKWLTNMLLELERLGVIDVTLEQKAQKVLHVTVFREYGE